MTLPRNPPMNWALIIVLPVIFLGSCASPTGQTSDSRTQANDSHTISATNRSPTPLRPTATTPAPSPSATPMPTITPTSTRVIKTPTPLPTLNKQERETMVKRLLATNANCKLPCWWGVTPGLTTWSELKQTLHNWGVRTSVHSANEGRILHSTGGFDLDNQGIYNNVEFFEIMGIIDSISVDSFGFENSDYKTLWASYAPEKILSVYGKPSRVWLSSHSTNPEGALGPMVPYNIGVFYDHLGLLIRYSGKTENRFMYRICPNYNVSGNLSDDLEIFLQAPGQTRPLEDISDYRYIAKELIRPLEEATEITIEDFYNIIMGVEGDGCFETPREIWP